MFTVQATVSVTPMLTGQNFGSVFNSRYGRTFVPPTSFTTAKRSNLKLKIWLGQLFGYLLLSFVLYAPLSQGKQSYCRCHWQFREKPWSM